jgi:ATP-dependent DNA helicase RecG
MEEIPAGVIKEATPQKSLSDSVQFLRGVGPSGTEAFMKLGISTVGDLLRYMPRRYEDRSSFRNIAQLQPGEFATISGRVLSAENTQTSRRNFVITRVLISDDTGTAILVFFQQPYLLKQFERLAVQKRRIIVYAQVKSGGWGAPELDRIEWEELSEDADSLSTNRIVPIYPLTEKLTQKRVRKAVDHALEAYVPLVREQLPARLIKKHALLDIASALRNVHFPVNMEIQGAAHRRLVFEEFFLLQLGLAIKRAALAQERTNISLRMTQERLQAKLREILPFELTGAQWRAIMEISADVSSGHTMNRLLQGDVGSGKTVVALATMFMAVENGYQAALMAPTEILAQQHAIVLRRLLEPIGMNVDLAIGSMRVREKEGVRGRLYTGETPIAVGTHALIQEGVNFHRLGLAIVDEQHRFGVLQRQALSLKGAQPHVLVMTATPIPRTLTMSIFGDLDVSIIDELPPGRKPIKTHWKHSSDAASVYASAEKLIGAGRQVYIVCPLIEESEKLQVKSAIQLAEKISREVYPQFRVGLLHGQMKSEEKDQIMGQFKAHELDVLVSTTVIEVGIDVPNATVMIVEDADRFGLSQLHQLRGRVGRGEHISYCILIADPKTEDGITRMRIMTETTDGFRIAEEDLKLRGPGEFLGTRQSGLPEFRFGDIVQDSSLMTEARESAFDLIREDPELRNPEYKLLKESLHRSMPGFELIHVS